MKTPSRSRHSRRGFALIATLAGITLLAGTVLVLQAGTAADAVVAARIERHHLDALGVQSIYAQVSVEAAALRAGAPPAGGLSLGGRPFTREYAGQSWQVTLSDVEGLADLYLSPPSVLALLPGDPTRLALVRAADPRLAGGTRYLTEAQTMARFGLTAEERARLAPLVTQRARTGAINPLLAPPGFGALRPMMQDADIAGGEVAEVAIVARVPDAGAAP